MSTWRGASNGAVRGGSSAPALPAGLAGRPRGRGRGAARGASRGAAGAGGFARSSNLSWRAPAAQQPEEGAMDEGQDEGDEEEPEDGSSGGTTPSAFPAFGSAPSAFGTPAFAGGASSSAFGGGGSVFGGGGATTSAFGGSAFGAGASTFSGSAFGSSRTPSAFTSAPPPPPAAVAEAPAPAFVPSRPPSTNQISTLEVLGEDSDSRKKRFESSLANNRFMELKPLREAQRARDIKAGLIPDPLKPMRLDQATDFLGTCVEMCPEFEREEREYQNNVDLLERYPGTNRIDPSRAVKAFHRPAAGNDQPLPSDVRPPHILKSTLDYLFHDLLPTQPLHLTHPFLRDRTRAIRQDFTMQNERGVVAIECNERIARYHVLALGALREQSGFSESQELEQLRKVLKSLNEFYDDARISNPPIPTPNEAEFRCYNILTHLRDPDIIWSSELLPPHVFGDPLFQLALSLHSLAQRSNISRGERASPNAASRFFKLVSRPDVPYLFSCILSTHFADIRKNALEAMKNSYLHQHSLYPARTLAKVLGCDDEVEVEAVCSKLGFSSKQAENGRLVVELHKAAVMKNGVITPHVSQRLVEAKRGSTPYQQVIDGASYSSGDVNAIPSTPWVAGTPAFPSAPTVRPAPPVIATATTFAPPPKAPSAHPSTQTFHSLGAPPAPTAPPPPSVFSATLQPSASPFTPAFAVPSSSPFAPPPAAALPNLNPIAPSFVPTRPTPPPQPPAPQPQQPAFSFTGSAPPAPPPVVVEPPAPRPVKKLPTASFPTAAPPTPLPTLRKPSLQVAPPPPPPPPAPKLDRTPLIKSLAASLTDELIRYVVQFPVRRAVELALKERWERVRQRQQEGRQILTRRLTDELVGEAVRREVRRLAVGARRERALSGRFFAEWRVRAVQSQERRAAEEERRKRFGEVAGEIGVGSTWEDDEQMDDEDVGGLDMSSLSIERGGSLAHGEGAAKADCSMAARLKQAEIDRHRIWSPATFLDIVSERIDAAFSHLQLSKRPSWSAIISTADLSSPFASWLACKFDLSGSDLVASMDTAHVDVDVQMIGEGDTPSDESMNDTGLIIFDCTAYGSLLDSPWTLAQQRLAALVQKADRQSLYNCHLLVIHCPDRSLLPDAEATLKSQLLSDLAESSLGNLKSTSVLLARLQDAESQVADALDGPLSAVEVRSERVCTALATFVEPLLEIWRAALQQAVRLPILPDPVRLLAVFIEALNVVLGEARTASSPAVSLAALPGFGASDAPLRSKLRTYIERPAFASAGHFPFVDAELARRPPLPDFTLAKLLLEHLATFALDSTAKATTRQQTLTDTLPTSLVRLETSLQESVASLTPFENGIGSLLKMEKKRKASLGPPVETSHKKQLFGDSAHEQLGAGDKLSALDAIMRDARGLLAQ